MTRFFKFILHLVFLLVWVMPVFAGGSIYSLRGFGTLLYYPGGRASGMGGTVISSASSTNLNWINPAALAVQNHVRISAQFLWNNINIQKRSESFRSNYANFNGFMGAFPVKAGLGVGFGIQPYSRINYRYEERKDIETDLYFHNIILKRGGLTRAFLGMGLQLHPRLLLGAGVYYYFGKLGEHWWLVYNREDFADTHDEIRSKFSGTQAYFGVLSTPISGWTVGAVYRSSANLTEDRDQVFYVPEISESYEVKSRIPELWGVGTSVYVSKQIAISMDYLEQDWAKDQSADQGLTTLKRISWGLEYAEPMRLSMSNWERLRYRIGFAYEEPYFLDFDGKDLREYKVTLGIGVPFASGAGAIDIAFEYGKRGSEGKNRFSETILGLNIFVSGGELWFQR